MYVTNQSELDAEISAFPWHDSYVREAHVSCPSYTDPADRGVVAPDSKWLLRLVICSQDEQFPGIEFIFEGVDGLSLECRVDLDPRGTIADGEVVMFMTSVDATPIRAERLRIEHLGVEVWGPNGRYCEGNQFDDRGYRRVAADEKGMFSVWTLQESSTPASARTAVASDRAAKAVPTDSRVEADASTACGSHR